eukprot:jgi/Botrbrau1/7312/Bobra.247_3s0007.1
MLLQKKKQREWESRAVQEEIDKLRTREDRNRPFVEGKGRRRTVNLLSWDVPFSPFGWPMLTWNSIMAFVDATYSAFLIPLGVAFHFRPTHFTWYTPLNVAAGAMFWLDIIFSFLTGFIVVHNLRRRLVFNFGRVAHFYIFQSTFLADVLSAVPALLEVIMLPIAGVGAELAVRIVFLLRLFRLVRVYRLIQWLIFISLIGRLSHMLLWISVDVIFLFNVLYAIAVFLNVLASLWYFIASLEGPENSWLSSSQIMSLVEAPKWQQYIASLYFVTTTLTTVGYGDITPVTPAEQIVAICIMLVGIVFFGFAIGSSQELIKYLSKSTQRTAALRGKMQKVEEWATKRHLPKGLRRTIRAYYADVWLPNRGSGESEIFGELPAVLRTRVAFALTRELLSHSSVFEGLTKAQQRAVASRLQPITLMAGHDLARQGDDATCLWLLQEGSLLSLRNGKEVELVRAPAIMGEVAILARENEICRTRPMTFRALTHSRLWKLSLHDLDQVLHVVPELRQHLERVCRAHFTEVVCRYPDDATEWYDLINGCEAHWGAGERPSRGEGRQESGNEGVQATRASPHIANFDAEQVPFPPEYRAAGDEFGETESSENSEAEEQMRSLQNYGSEEDEDIYRSDVDESTRSQPSEERAALQQQP